MGNALGGCTASFSLSIFSLFAFSSSGFLDENGFKKLPILLAACQPFAATLPTPPPIKFPAFSPKYPPAMVPNGPKRLPRAAPATPPIADPAAPPTDLLFST